jgi:hypothetical protein
MGTFTNGPGNDPQVRLGSVKWTTRGCTFTCQIRVERQLATRVVNLNIVKLLLESAAEVNVRNGNNRR